MHRFLRPLPKVAVIALGRPYIPSIRCCSSTSSEEGVQGANPDAANLYDRLGLGKTATLDEVKKNYRKLVKRYHPDLNPGDASAEDSFKKVKEAYEILTDDDRRRAYDLTGSAKFAEGYKQHKENQEFGSFKWAHGRYTYTTHDGKRVHNLPVFAMALGFATFLSLLVLSIRWLKQGTFLRNLRTFVTILLIISFLPRMPAALITFYIYAYERPESKDGIQKVLIR